jgi:hypothetical protein|tara:strand:+ start:1262 stop:1558 length:297 start_codon:yes stop_codon:yes gene_type:complete
MLVRSQSKGECKCRICDKIITSGEFKFTYRKKVTYCFLCGRDETRVKSLFEWIGYTRGFNWHLKLHNVSKKGKKTCWYDREDIYLATEELKQATMLEF